MIALNPLPTSHDITAVLCCYNRVSSLKKQIECLRRQTIPPKNIWIWQNHSENNQTISLDENEKDIILVRSSSNLKYHGRFALAQLVRTEYVFILDDDVFPQKRYIENCLQSMLKFPGIMTTMGVILNGDFYYPHTKYSWTDRHNDNTEEVDICCQSWFLKKEWIKYIWQEEPITWENGEDIQLSYLAKKYGNIKSYVPPQPVHDQTFWGNDTEMGVQYGHDENATWRTSNHVPLRNKICHHYIKEGWDLVRYSKLD